MTYDIISKRKYKKTIIIKKPDDIYNCLKRYAKSEQEYFIVMTLNGTHEVISIHIASFGLVNQTIIHPREVFKHAIREKACAVVISHSHPSGNTQPSGKDNEITTRMKKAADILGIHILDHLIIGKNGYFSYRSERLILSDISTTD